MLLVLVHLRCVGAIFTGGRHHPRARSCAGLGHHCALAATVPNDPAFIDGAREALFEAVASACLVVSGRCEGCASCISLWCDSTGLGNTHQGRRTAHERSPRPVTDQTQSLFHSNPLHLPKVRFKRLSRAFPVPPGVQIDGLQGQAQANHDGDKHRRHTEIRLSNQH